MNEVKDILNDLKKTICNSVEMVEEGVDRFRVFTPFGFEDGDSFSIVLKKVGNKFILSDEGNTLMHMSYEMEIEGVGKGTRSKIISNILDYYNIKKIKGAFIKHLDISNVGNALFDFIQALIKISDLTYLSREIIKSTFFEDFKSLLIENIDSKRLDFDYRISEYDSERKYPIDCVVNNLDTPLFIFAINGDDKCRDVTISLLQYEKWGIRHNAIAIFEDQEEISRRVLARLSDVTDKQFSSISSNKDRIVKYLKDKNN